MYYSVNRGNLTAHFLASLGYDALAYGNHEFDNGVDNLVAAMSQIPPNSDVALLSANMDADPATTGLKREDFMIREFVFNGVTTKVGVVGYTTPDTSKISNPGPDVTFSPVVPAVRKQVEELKKQGVEVVVAVGHAGIDTDKAICDEVDGVDIVVGGHTNTFLANAGSADTFPAGATVDETIEGPYPVVRRNGKCVVVQAYAYGKFIGSLQTEFDAAGELVSYSGDPVLMWGNDWPQDPAVLTYLEPFTATVLEYGQKVVGHTTRDIDGTRISCRLQECEMGNLVVDANVDNFRKNDASVVCGLANSGGIRTGIDAGDITYAEVLTVVPFGNTIDKATLTGTILKEAMEYSVSTFNSTGYNVGGEGRFLQISGLRVHYNLSEEVGSRVRELLILDPSEGSYHAVEPHEEYPCVIPSFLLGGGDGFDMFVGVPKVDGIKDGDVFAEFIENNSPLDGNDALKNIPSRILFDHENTDGRSDELSGSSSINYCIVVISLSALIHTLF